MKHNIIGIVLICIGITTTISCATEQNISQSPIINTIDLDNTEYASFNTKDLFKSIKVTTLDNSKVLIGAIDKMQLHNDLFIILDNSVAKGVFLFTKEGKFIRKIGSTGTGPEEYASCTDFTINKNDNSIYIYDSDNEHMLKYDLNSGKLKKTFNVNAQCRANHIHWNGNKLYMACSNRTPNGDKPQYILRELDTISGKAARNLFEVHQYNKSWRDEFINENPFYNVEDGADLFTYGFMDSIMYIKNGEITPYIALKSKDMVKAEDVQSILDQHSDYQASSELFRKLYKEKKIYDIRNIFKHNDYLYIDYLRGIGYRIKYNVRTKEATLYKHFRNGLLFAKEADNCHTPKFLTSDKKGIYYYIGIDYLSEIRNFAETEGTLSNDVINKSKLRNLDENSNPVLLYYEFKD